MQKNIFKPILKICDAKSLLGWPIFACSVQWPLYLLNNDKSGVRLRGGGYAIKKAKKAYFAEIDNLKMPTNILMGAHAALPAPHQVRHWMTNKYSPISFYCKVMYGIVHNY